MNLFTPTTVSKMRRLVANKTHDEAIDNLIKAAKALVKDCRYYPYRSHIDSLRIPLAQLKHSKPKT